MSERRKKERRRWGRKVTYPFIDSEGVLVTKNRRRKIDRREEIEEKDAEVAQKEPEQPAVAAAPKQAVKKSSIDISESKVMELEEALQDVNQPASGIMASIKDLEDEILDATNVEAISKTDFDAPDDFNAPSNEDRNDTPEKVPNNAPVNSSGKAPDKVSDKASIAAPLVTASLAAESKEIEEPVTLPEIEIAADAELDKSDNKVTIELLIKGEKHVLTTDKDTCKVGRDPSCDIIIQNKFVSRQHAKITFKNGKFSVEDSSFNGTYIEFTNGQKIHVSKDEQALIANGVMSMGKPVDGKSKSVIEFKISQ